MISKELVLVLFAWANNLSPYDGNVPPVVQMVDPIWLSAIMCEGAENCGVVGLYTDEGVVYIDSTLPPKERNEVIVHEMVHYLQDVEGMHAFHEDWKAMSECDQNYQREIEAYKVSSMWAVKNGYLPMPFVVQVYCDAEEEG